MELCLFVQLTALLAMASRTFLPAHKEVLLILCNKGRSKVIIHVTVTVVIRHVNTIQHKLQQDVMNEIIFEIVFSHM